MAGPSHPLRPLFQNVIRVGIMQKAFKIDALLQAVPFRNLTANSLPLFHFSTFALNLLTPLFLAGCQCGRRLQFLAPVLAVSLEGLALKMLGNLRDEKSDGILDFRGTAKERLAPRKFQDLFNRAIRGL